MLSRLRVGVPVLFALVLATGWLMGDTAKPADTKYKGKLPQYFKKLGLSDQQVQDVYKIQNNYAAKVEALAQQIRALRAEENAEIDKLLTDAQKARLRELKLGENPMPITGKPQGPDKAPNVEKKPEPEKKTDGDKDKKTDSDKKK